MKKLLNVLCDALIRISCTARFVIAYNVLIILSIFRDLVDTPHLFDYNPSGRMLSRLQDQHFFFLSYFCFLKISKMWGERKKSEEQDLTNPSILVHDSSSICSDHCINLYSLLGKKIKFQPNVSRSVTFLISFLHFAHSHPLPLSAPSSTHTPHRSRLAHRPHHSAI